jgi:two-component system nitrogen regulation response regulator NtrX
MNGTAVSVLHIEDDPEAHELLKHSLARSPQGRLEIHWAASDSELQKLLAHPFALVFLDLHLWNGKKGLDLLPRIRKALPQAEIIILSSEATFANAQKAVRLGANDFVVKGFSPEELRFSVERAMERRRWKKIERSVVRNFEHSLRSFTMVGKAKVFLRFLEKIEKVAPTPLAVLLEGETGVGKELVAKWIHLKSGDPAAPFVAINCGGIPVGLAESFLFGHEKGAFTGATQSKMGAFEEADGGTLFLDEINSLPLELQAKLLRAIQEKEVRRLGGKELIPVEIRIVAAANEDLLQMVQKGRFREDLYYRVASVNFSIPPLRERKDDIALLASHFSAGKEISKELLQHLQAREWRGNVRELQNLMRRLVVLYPDDPILTLEHLEESSVFGGRETEMRPKVESAKSLKKEKHELELRFLREQYEDVKGNVSKLSRILKMDRSHLHNKLVQMGIHKISRF